MSDLRKRVLIVDDEPELRRLLVERLGDAGYGLLEASSGEEALRVFTATPCPVVILDLVLGDLDGLKVLETMRAIRPETKIIVLTAHASIETAIGALRLGAFDYLRKGPHTTAEVQPKVRQAFEAVDLRRQNARLVRELERSQGMGPVAAGLERRAEGSPEQEAGDGSAGMIGRSRQMRDLFRQIEQVARTDATVLVRGETGTGKELVARAIHSLSHRFGQPFVVVDGNIPEELAEAELFGVARDYPGFHRKDPMIGQFEVADGGTLFLDEIGDLPRSLQPKLLRVLQQGELRPLGSRQALRVDLRIIAATNRDLETAIAEGQFRADLYHRLNVVTIWTPPLRERRDDIPHLAAEFLHRSCAKLKRRMVGLSDDALKVLLKYHYPGNVRELENLIERAVIVTEGETIGVENLPPLQPEGTAAAPLGISPEMRLDEVIDAVEIDYLRRQLERAQGNISEAARNSGIDRKTLRQKLKRHGIDSGLS